MLSIASDQLRVNANEAMALWNGEQYGADQEAYVTLTDLNTVGSSELGLILKSQGTGESDDSRIEVSYFAGQHRIVVWSHIAMQGWVQHGADLNVTMEEGDVFGARALPNGTVQILRNNMLIGQRNVINWPHYASGGSIGMSFYSASGTHVDDFGGGTIGEGEMLMAPWFSMMESMSAETTGDHETTSEFVLLAAPQTRGLGQKAYIYLPSQNSENSIAAEKPTSYPVEHPGDIKILFDVDQQRIQILVFSATRGWIQHGVDIPVTYADADRFKVVHATDDMIEIYRNGALLARRTVTR